jgi:hypothetical protein
VNCQHISRRKPLPLLQPTTMLSSHDELADVRLE